MKECDFINFVGIVAEFNPIHNGHAHLISAARQMGADCVVASLSGNFVQRGDTAIISKSARAEAALKCGIDLCLELPVAYSMSTAQNFAYGSVYSLVNAGVDTIIFGSECGDIDLLKEIAEVLLSPAFKAELDRILPSGCSFPAARQASVAAILGQEKAKALELPNNNLGIEYIIAAKNMGAGIDFVTVHRIGAEHDSAEQNPICPSASFIRNAINQSNFESIRSFIPEKAAEIILKEINEGRISDINRLERAVLTVLRTTDETAFSRLPDISEGIEKRIYKAATAASSLEELYSLAKTKRYTSARIRRLVLGAFLGMDKDFFLSPPPYIRVLGHTETGRNKLKSIDPAIPFYSRVSEITASADKRAQKMFKLECNATDIYQLSFENVGKCGKEFTEKLIVL